MMDKYFAPFIFFIVVAFGITCMFILDKKEKEFMTMNEITITINEESEMMKIGNKDKTVFYGNFWDFNRPEDIIKLLKEIHCIHTTVNYTKEEF